MHTDDLVVDNCNTWQTIESVAKLLPYFHAETTATFIIESIYAVNSCALMVSSQDEEIFRILDFVSEKKTDNLNRLLSTVNIVTKEKIVGLWVAKRKVRKLLFESMRHTKIEKL